MSLPDPRSGLVIGYSYLWHAEFEAGQEEGGKDRPCAVVIASRTEAGDLVVTVAAITHSVPVDPMDAIEIPAVVKRLLNLDEHRSWLVCTELNRFVWPGPDLRPISRTAPGEFVYGVLPGAFMKQVFALLQELRAARKLRAVFRPA